MRTGAFQTFPSLLTKLCPEIVRHTSCQWNPKSRQRRKEQRASRTDDEILGGWSANLPLPD